MGKLLEYIIDRLDEPTSWIAICTASTFFGINIAPEWQDAIVTFGVSLGCFLGFILRETDKRLTKLGKIKETNKEVK